MAGRVYQHKDDKVNIYVGTCEADLFGYYHALEPKSTILVVDGQITRRKGAENEYMSMCIGKAILCDQLLRLPQGYIVVWHKHGAHKKEFDDQLDAAEFYGGLPCCSRALLIGGEIRKHETCDPQWYHSALGMVFMNSNDA
eukprot:CAMPEP_0181327022 /NCGR_PEP_ID=MMETSP1101-20121128/21848_1 /TAXON_ID=46948 /ORGANISM="Rhodomonas abbreviata, Strain Caron Lab Isolate" /LENGTH=140 /DNA_ID=CAMNT_0023435591 /DNA_START=109 /DNA_END=531 /DNA_ORIENTATION=+